MSRKEFRTPMEKIAALVLIMLVVLELVFVSYVYILRPGFENPELLELMTMGVVEIALLIPFLIYIGLVLFFGFSEIKLVGAVNGKEVDIKKLIKEAIKEALEESK